jgi:hypothetical protein
MLRPFVTPASPKFLADSGYLIEDSVARIFAAPDEEVLLDDTFAATHCFTLGNADDEHAGQTALRFSPTRNRDSLVDVGGIAWIDQRAAKLRSIEFHYTSLEPAAMDVRPGGSVQFETASNGVAFVARWNLAIPEIERALTVGTVIAQLRPGGASKKRRNERQDVRLTRVVERGGLVLSAEWKDGTRWSGAPSIVSGIVVDRATHAGIPHAVVTLRGTRDTIDTDDGGEFEVETVPGKYRVVAADTNGASSFGFRIDSSVVIANHASVATAVIEVLGRVSIAALTAAFEGRVLREETGSPVENVEIAIPALSRRAMTRSDGSFRFAGLPPGTYGLRVRHLGEEPILDSVQLAPGATEHRVVKLRAAARLDTVVVTASSGPAAFEAHRATRLGTYVGDSVFKAHSRQQLGDVLRLLFEGLRLLHLNGSTHVALDKGFGRGPLGTGTVYCIATIFVDGQLVYDPVTNPSWPPPDISSFLTADIVGAEFYRAKSKLPADLIGGSANCATLVLWTRRK